MILRFGWIFSLLLFVFVVSIPAAVVINEIGYNLPESATDSSESLEFLELYNSGPETVDLSAWSFVDGVQFAFPKGTAVDAGATLILVRNPSARKWRGRTVYGPYSGTLSDQGEKVTLRRPDGTVEDSVSYKDTSPWPRNPDGYGSSLERISPDLPSDDFHSWRSSTVRNGTPGDSNTVIGVPPRPMLLSYETQPPHPTSRDAVTVRVALDAPAEIAEATLQWEIKSLPPEMDPADAVFPPILLTRREELGDTVLFEGVIPPQPSQSLVQWNLNVRLQGGTSLLLPQPEELCPFGSYFVYDNEIRTGLPLLWVYKNVATVLPGYQRTFGAVVIKTPSDPYPLPFNGAHVQTSRNGSKIHFLKGEEYKGNRTFNLIPERGGSGGSSGPNAPFREYFGFRLFRQMEVLSPAAEWYRIVAFPQSNPAAQTQQVVIQQINGHFLTLNNLDPDGYLYKLVYYSPIWENHSRREEETYIIHQLEWDLRSVYGDERRRLMEEKLQVEVLFDYIVTSVYLTNWDGFFNNNWMYRGSDEKSKWCILPWDLDKVWGFTDSNPLYMEMPVDYPLTGYAPDSSGSRPTGPITGPMMEVAEWYEEYVVRLRREMDRTFAPAHVREMIDGEEQRLLADVQMLENQYGITATTRRRQIEEACKIIRTYIQGRTDYLLRNLPNSLEDWEVY